ncbi:MAG: hypothetical protein DHS80DRAFT_33537 [Piptocephalis tieghemiana]|nr:MAG: hypothetical protein DHS80DRAFT_33537 [Piptocephalis tieghemiana]
MSTDIPDFLPPLLRTALSSSSSQQEATEAKEELTTRVREATLPLSTLFLALAPDMTSESATSRLSALRLLTHLLPSCPSLTPSGGDVILRFVASRLSTSTTSLHISVPEILALGEIVISVLDLGRIPRTTPSCSASGIETLLTQFLPGVLEEAGREEGRTPEESRMTRQLLRSLSYRLLQTLSTGHYVESYALAHPKVLGAALQEASEGERDPQGLILLFHLTSILLPILDQTSWVQGDSEVASNLFDIPFRYFPITFRSPLRPGFSSGDGGEGREGEVEEEVREALAQALYALAPCPTLGPLMYTAIVDKASASSWACRRDVWRVLRGAGGGPSADHYDPSGDVLLVNCPPGSEGGKEARVSLLKQCLPLLGIFLHSLLSPEASEGTSGPSEEEAEEKLGEVASALLDSEMTPLALAEPILRVILLDVPKLQRSGEPDGSELLAKLWFSRTLRAVTSSQGTSAYPHSPSDGRGSRGWAIARRSGALLSLSLTILGKCTESQSDTGLNRSIPPLSSYHASSEESWCRIIMHGLVNSLCQTQDGGKEEGAEEREEEEDEVGGLGQEEEYRIQALGCLVAGSEDEGEKALECLVGLVTGETEGSRAGGARGLRQKRQALRVLSQWLDQNPGQEGPKEDQRKKYAVDHLLPLLVGAQAGSGQGERGEKEEEEEENVDVYYPLLVVSGELLSAFLSSSFSWLEKPSSTPGHRGKEVWRGLFDALLHAWSSHGLKGAQKGNRRGAKNRGELSEAEKSAKIKGQRMGTVVYEHAFVPLVQLILKDRKCNPSGGSMTRNMGHIVARVSSFLSLTTPSTLEAWIQENGDLKGTPGAHLILEAILVGSPPLPYMESEERVRIIQEFQSHLGEEVAWDAWFVAAMMNKYAKDAEPLGLTPGDEAEAQALYLRAIPTNQATSSPYLTQLLGGLLKEADGMQEEKEESTLIKAILTTLLNPPSYPNLFYKGDGSIRRPLQHQRIRSTLIARLVKALETGMPASHGSSAAYYVLETALLSKAPGSGTSERGRGQRLDPVVPWDQIIHALKPVMNVELDQMEGGTRSMAEKARWGAIRVLRDGILRSSGQENKENCSDPESLAILLKTFILPSLRETSPRVRLEALSGLLDVLRRVRESSVRGVHPSSSTKDQQPIMVLRSALQQSTLQRDVEALRDDPHRAVRRRVVLVLSLLRDV